MKKILVGLLLVSISNILLAEENDSYLCIADKSTGFHYSNGEWRQVSFNVKNEKFIIRKLKKISSFIKDKSLTYGAIPLGSNNPEHFCRPPGEFSHSIICPGGVFGVGQLFFSLTTGRYIETYPAGYWDGVDENKNTPHITIGRCSKI